MAQALLRQDLGQGVVITRQDTALRDGELQGAQFCRMQPGNTEQVYVDRDYDYYPLDIQPGEQVINCHYMNFEEGQTFCVIVQTRLNGTGRAIFIDLDALPAKGDVVTPATIEPFDFDPSESSLVNRGAEWFFNVVGTDASGNKVGHQRIFLIGSTGTLRSRRVGLDPSGLTIGVERSLPVLSENLWDETDDVVGWYSSSTAYTAFICVNNHLYGSSAALIEEWETPQQREDSQREGWNALRGQSTFTFRDVPGLAGFSTSEVIDKEAIIRSLVVGFVPLTKISLVLSGQGNVFGYWGTEYRSAYAVESAPSEVVTVTSGDPQGASWELTLDYQKFIDDGFIDQWASYAKFENRNEFLKISGLSDEGWWEYVDKIVASFKADIVRGSVERFITGTFELSEAQRDALTTKLSVEADVANSSADQVRIYRQNLGIYDRYLVDWVEGHANTPQPSEPVGEGQRNAEDIKAGRITRQGGLLTTLEVSDLPTEYEDNYQESGVSDPGFAFPTISYVTRGGLGVYDYLRLPSPSSVVANMAQSLLRVEWGDDAPERNIILVAPDDDPDQAPLRYAIPVVTKNQDEVKAITTMRDTAVIHTTTSAFHLNYIPFEGNNQIDRVLTQLTSNHGVNRWRQAIELETTRGQIVVWLSQTSLMATNGYGVFDICPDFSVDAALELGYTFTDPILTNNAREHRLELWSGNTRWDFLYHPSHMKDIRGDGSGLVFKMMGPTNWYQNDTAEVVGACSGLVSGTYRTMHVYQETDRQGGHVFAFSADAAVKKGASIETRKLWGSNPTSRLRVIRAGVQHPVGSGSPDWIRIATENTSPNTQSEGAGSDDNGNVPIDHDAGYSDRFIREGMGTSNKFDLEWAGSPVGPLWVQEQENSGGTTARR